ANVAMGGNFGYELDITKLPMVELEELRKQITLYKSIRKSIQFGDIYSLVSPFESQNYATLHVNKEKSEAVLIYVHVLAEANGPFHRVKLAGLDPNKDYKILETNEIFGGDELMYM